MIYTRDQQEQILHNAELYVHQLLAGEGSGHDWWHVYRVVKNAQKLILTETCDEFVVLLSAWVHDIGDHKLHNGDETATRREIQKLFSELELDQELTERVIQIVEEVSFKGAQVETPVSSIEAAIVQDADRLDAIGAIGIARTFAYGGNKNREIYNPEIPPVMHDNFADYKSNTAPTINHFYEKLLLLKDLMNTKSGKVMAEQRHTFMESFLQQFYEEWGEKHH